MVNNKISAEQTAQQIKTNTQKSTSKPDFVESKDNISKVIKSLNTKKVSTNDIKNINNTENNIKQQTSQTQNKQLNTKQTSNDLLETYAGMVGDKRINNGLSLDLVMETRNIGSWLLIITGKDIHNSKLVKTSLQKDPTRFFIDVNTNLVKDKTVNFTYQMPKDIRLKYGNQENGYRIAIDLPQDTKIVTQNVLKDEISLKFVNTNIIEEYQQQEERKKTDNSQKDIPTIQQIQNNVQFQKIKLNHKKPFIIAIDAGHGGIDSGAISVSGKYEKKITLMYAKKLKEALQKRGAKVIMTREADKSVALADRVKISQQANADLFISLHTDAHNNPKISGTTVYRLSNLDKEHPDWNRFYNKNYLPKQYENYVNNHGILDILVGMAHKTVIEKTSIMVDNILLSFKKNKICKYCRYGQRSLAVLRGLDMLSILIEIGYISNKEEERKMLLESNIELFSTVLANSIMNSFEE